MAEDLRVEQIRQYADELDTASTPILLADVFDAPPVELDAPPEERVAPLIKLDEPAPVVALVRRRRTWLLISAAAAVLVIAALVGFGLSGDDDSRTITDTPSTTTEPATTSTTTAVAAGPMVDLPTVDVSDEVIPYDLTDSAEEAGVFNLLLVADDNSVVAETLGRSAHRLWLIDPDTGEQRMFDGNYPTEGGIPTGPPAPTTLAGGAFWYLSNLPQGEAVDPEAEVSDGQRLIRLDLATGSEQLVDGSFGDGSVRFLGDRPLVKSMAGEVVVVNVATTRDPRQVVHDRIDRYDAATGTLLSSVELSEQIASVSGDAAAGHGYVWATQPTPDDRMARIDPATGEVVRLDARSQGRVLIGNEDVWVVSNESIDRIDTATLSASVLPAPWEGTTLALAGRFAGPPPAALAGDHLLVGVVVRTEEEVPRADRPVQALVRVDLRTGLLDAQIELGDAAPKRSDTASPSLNEIVVGGDTLWFGGTYGLASVPLNAVLGPAS